ncbi:MAG: zinc ribbon domain-containing protein [Promethearchaeota archaeon]
MSSYCTNCGTKLEESWKLCPNCGKTLREGVISQVQAPVVEINITLICPNCKKPITEEQVICLNCGIQLKQIKSEKGLADKATSCCIWYIIVSIIVGVILVVVLIIPSYFL